MNKARENILQRLRHHQVDEKPQVPLYVPSYDWSVEQRIETFSRHIQAVHGQVERVKRNQWLSALKAIAQQKNIKDLLFSAQSAIGKDIAEEAWEELKLMQYERSMEGWKGEMFSQVDASITTTEGAIAETGSLILWPSVDQPRLMSLVPPIHIAVLDAEQLYDTFAQAVQQQNWAQGMPTNALLISGPSKTADIEQVLAYGVHGPKELVIIIRE